MRSEFLLALSCRVMAVGSAIVCGFFSLRLVGRYLEPAEFGVVLVALQLMNYLPLLDGGFRTATNRRLLADAGGREKAELIRFSQTFYTYFGLAALAVALLVMCGYGWIGIGARMGVPLRFYAALGVTGSLLVVSSAQIGLLVGLRAQHVVYALSTVGYWLNFLFLWYGLRKGWGVWAFALASLVNFLGTFPPSMVLIRQREPHIRFFRTRLDELFWGMFRKLRREAWECFRSQLATLFLYTFDVVLVGFLCGAAESGIYGVLTRVFTMLRAFLQSSGEVAWPIVARLGVERSGFQRHLEHVNAWVYGAVCGSIATGLIPIVRWFLGTAWEPPPVLVGMVAVRFLVTGLAAPATYFLYGLGEFRTLSRYLEREFLAAVVLSIPGAMIWGVKGVAGAFLAGTVCGTLWPLLQAYAQKMNRPILLVAGALWVRAVAGAAAGVLSTAFFLKYFPSGPATLLAAGGGFAAAMLLAAASIGLKILIDKGGGGATRGLAAAEKG